MNTVDVLRKAASVIEQRGWSKGTDMELDGRVCANGALRIAVGQQTMGIEGIGQVFARPLPDGSHRHLVLAHRVLDQYVDREGLIPATRPATTSASRIIWFNDRVADTPADVCRVLRAAADDLERGVTDTATWIVDQELKRLVPLPEFTAPTPIKEAVSV